MKKNLFLTQLQKYRHKKENYDIFEYAINQLEEDENALYEVYAIAAQGDRGLTKRGGRSICMLLENYTMQKMIRLSESFRQHTSIEWFIDWKNICPKDLKGLFETEKDYIAFLVLGSFHPNGYYREKCVYELGKYPETLPFLVLRMNDWVGNIRDGVAGLITERVNNCAIEEILMATLALDKVKQSERRNSKDLSEVEKLIMKRIKCDISMVPLYKICKYEHNIKRNIYRFLFSEKILDIEKAEYLLDKEKHSFCQAMIMSGIIKNYHCTMEQIDKFLSHKNYIVRRKALEYKYEKVKNSWTGLEKLLLDDSRAVRELTVFILKRHSDFNVQDFYICHLEDKNPTVAIIGLGELGNNEVANILMPFLNDSSAKVVRNTICSIGKLGGQNKEDIFWKYLFNDNPSISKASYQAIRNNRIYYGAETLYQEFNRCKAAHIKRYLTLLIMQETSWNRLPYLIYLYETEDMKDFNNGLLSCMARRNLYVKISRKQEAEIEMALEKSGDRLPKDLVEQIRFDMKFVTR